MVHKPFKRLDRPRRLVGTDTICATPDIFLLELQVTAGQCIVQYVGVTSPASHGGIATGHFTKPEVRVVRELSQSTVGRGEPAHGCYVALRASPSPVPTRLPSQMSGPPPAPPCATRGSAGQFLASAGPPSPAFGRSLVDHSLPFGPPPSFQTPLLPAGPPVWTGQSRNMAAPSFVVAALATAAEPSSLKLPCVFVGPSL